MTVLSLAIGCGLAILILTKIISSVIIRRRWQVEAARHGCEPAPTIRMGFMGLVRILRYLRAAHEEQGPPQVVEALDELGISGNVHTARATGEHNSVVHERSLWF